MKTDENFMQNTMNMIMKAGEKVKKRALNQRKYSFSRKLKFAACMMSILLIIMILPAEAIST